MDRKEFIGSSEIAAVLGLHPYITPLKLWAIKSGKIEPDDLSDNEAVEWGTRLERVVSKKFSEKHNVKLIAYKKRFVHDQFPFLSCELDNIIAGTDEMVEIKTANAFLYKQWDKPDQIPVHYICQVMFALGISKRRVGHIAVLIGGQKYLEKKVEFDEPFFRDMVEKAVVFMQLVKDGIPPTAISGDDQLLAEINPTAGEELQDVQELNDTIRLLQETKMHIDNLEEQKKELEIKIKDRIISESRRANKELLGIKTAEYIVKWSPMEVSKVDVALMKEKEPDVCAKYMQTYKSRRMTVNKNKGGSDGNSK